MALIQFSLQHGRSLSEAQASLKQAVDDLQRHLGALVQRVEWSPDRSAASMVGRGFDVEISLDDQRVYLEGDIPLLAKLLGSPVVAGIKKILEQKFQKKLTETG